jgi:NhaA family Na+:H+ antiporter
VHAQAFLKPALGAVVRPFQAFFRLEASSGILLLAAAVAALGWANSPFAESYRAFVTTPIALGIAGARVELSPLSIVNDGLMTIFFFVVGLEIKRELSIGELSSPAQAALPAIAALGGMVIPAAIFAAVNRGGPGARGWGVPMATDIAFAVGALTLLRRRVPHALVVFVTALAIFDDIGGILVIALFYGEGLDVGWLAAAAAIAAGAFALGRLRVRRGAAWAAVGAALWWALHHAGIHATISGVVLGLAVPVRPLRRAHDVLGELAAHTGRLAAEREDDEIGRAELAAIEAHLERLLHPWVAFGIMPVFALVNSGVALRGLGADELAGPVAVGVAGGLLAG